MESLRAQISTLILASSQILVIFPTVWGLLVSTLKLSTSDEVTRAIFALSTILFVCGEILIVISLYVSISSYDRFLVLGDPEEQYKVIMFKYKRAIALFKISIVFVLVALVAPLLIYMNHSLLLTG